MRISAFLEDFAARKHARGCTSAGLHSRRVEDNTPYLLGFRLCRPGGRRAPPLGSWAGNGSAQQMLEDGQRCLAHLFGFTLDAAILLQPVWPGVISLAPDGFE